MIGSPGTHDRLTRELAAGIGARVVSLGYALAPERSYPQGLDDCAGAARWPGTRGGLLGLDTARLLIGGDSAGGNLAAAALDVLEDAPHAFAQMFMLDMATDALARVSVFARSLAD